MLTEGHVLSVQALTVWSFPEHPILPHNNWQKLLYTAHS